MVSGMGGSDFELCFGELWIIYGDDEISCWRWEGAEIWWQEFLVAFFRHSIL